MPAMVKKLLINAADPGIMRVAMVEEGRLEAYFQEATSAGHDRANIYKGVVANVEPSLGAAFVEYGAPRHGFLQINDLHPDYWPPHHDPLSGAPSIGAALRRGRELLVQVVKEASGGKGASLTTYLSLPGQYLVLTPGRTKRGVSRQIDDEVERGRLREIVQELPVPEGAGLIARTASQGRPKKELVANFGLLRRIWQDIRQQVKKAPAPSLLHKDDDLAVRAVRDLFTPEVSEILVDQPEVHRRLERFVALASPRRQKAVKLYRGKAPLFAKYQVEEQIKTIYQPRVELPSGGSIVIHPTEALVAVDVNSGKSRGAKQPQDTALAVNLEAAQEVARQLRLRDLGGLVVIDFIDMRERRHQRQVRQRLVGAMKADKAKVTIGTISRFGLLELSRQRLRPPADYGEMHTCPRCGGRGLLRTPGALSRQALRATQHRLGRASGGLRLAVPPEVAAYILNQRRHELAELESSNQACLEVVADPSLEPEEFRLSNLAEAWILPQTQEPAPPPASPPEAPEVPLQEETKKRRRRHGAQRRRAKRDAQRGNQGRPGK